MTRRNNHNDDRARAPGWEDVTEAQRWLSSGRPGLAVITMDTDGCSPLRGAMRVRVAWYPGGHTLTTAQHSVTAFWPTVRHKTMPALLYRLLVQLDHVIGAAEAAEGAGLPF